MHIPIMVNEILKALKIKSGGFYIDGTYGAGGHTKKILERQAAVLAFDKDQDAVERANELIELFPNSFQIENKSFSNILESWKKKSFPMLADGMILDLGFSSNQIDDLDRGFSFRLNGPLDMRYDLTQELDAAKWVNSASVSEMADVFFKYGQDKNGLKIAKEIYKVRSKKILKTTFDLVEIINKINVRDGKHASTRIFQAIRIHINDEFSNIYKVIEDAKKILKHNAVLAVLTFHSLEDKIVKDLFANELNFINYPSEEEIALNPRSASAKLRWMIKTEMDCVQ